MKERSLPILIAFKVLGLHPDLSVTQRRAGAALLDSFNHKTGRCDPGLDRIAKLLNVHRRTVIRAIQQLESRGLFRRIRHGGYSHRNRYEPTWSRFMEMEAQWKERFEADAKARRAELSRSRCHSGHVEGGSAATQTCLNNQLNKTCQQSQPRKEIEHSVTSRGKPATSTIRIKPGDAARAAALRRWSDALHMLFADKPITYGEVIEAIDEKMAEDATDAEMRGHGTGHLHILRRLRIPEPPSHQSALQRDRAELRV